MPTVEKEMDAMERQRYDFFAERTIFFAENKAVKEENSIFAN